jgi:2-oxoglutarate ferredoxin oxidoreductase subunit alpha
MPTRTQQCDILLCAYASHGDTKHLVLFPANPKEAFEFAAASFDLAERFQTPVFVLLDLDIGMNDWMIPKLEWDDAYVPDRGKVLSGEELEDMEHFYRYLDVDGDHIAARTLPGVHPNGSYFTRGSGHDKYGRYTEGSDEYVEVVDRLLKKIHSSADHVPAPEVHTSGAKAEYGLISVGGCHWAVLEARDELAARGIDVDYLRVRAFPFNSTVEEFIEAHEHVFVVEQNRDEQLRKLLTIETACSKEKMGSITYYGGQPLSKGHVLDGLETQLPEVFGRQMAAAEVAS